MPKLTTLISILALSTTLGLAGCNKDKDQAKPADDKAMAKPDEKQPEAKPTEAKPEEKKAEEKPTEAKPAASGELPAECTEYKAAIEKLASCDKLPQQTRDALKQAYEQASAAWANVPAEGKAALGTACKSAVDAVKQAGTVCP
jgi:hypothetical protein